MEFMQAPIPDELSPLVQLHDTRMSYGGEGLRASAWLLVPRGPRRHRLRLRARQAPGDTGPASTDKHRNPRSAPLESRLGSFLNESAWAAGGDGRHMASQWQRVNTIPVATATIRLHDTDVGATTGPAPPEERREKGPKLCQHMTLKDQQAWPSARMG